MIKLTYWLGSLNKRCCILYRVTANRAVGYRVDGSEAVNVDWNWAAPAFQAYSTASDLAKVCWCYSVFLYVFARNLECGRLQYTVGYIVTF